ncbi:uncharacterized protein TEOVI_000149100 [Trypanosoma equiperdum]|uniref:Uncharacterized protein n=2 Tax=Trypanozoon TaxID=39700 RepID=Q57XW6_TRYB2|nr:hypothetical protein, conserved [Trypanosoma brucei brucei TREU927]AAX69553.1 hypothetical protein, conserved [Trypanosoma brucei]AAZ10168.1 hypothetical protein, conserved [Trypanosoma brucei brucei TREU927]SCU69922.1 hypothetical protein, conserved [Trypanosoma equiperdum]
MRGTVLIFGRKFSWNAVVDEYGHRLPQCAGLSSTRKRLLLKDWRYFTSTGSEESLTTFFRSGHKCTNSLEDGDDAHAHVKGNADVVYNDGQQGRKIHRALRGVAEFIAATGTFDDVCAPGERGYSDVSLAVEGLKRARLAVEYTGTVLSLSNDRRDGMLAQALSRNRRSDEEVVNQQHLRSHCGEVLSPLEVVAIAQWCAWHVRTSLKGAKHHQGTPTKSQGDAETARCIVSVLTRFLSILVEEGLRRWAVDSVACELELSDLVCIVTEEALLVLRDNKKACTSVKFATPLPTCSVGCSATSEQTALMAEHLKPGMRTWEDLCFGVKAQEALLCSQRERWQRALRLLLDVQRWNVLATTKNCTTSTEEVLTNECEGKCQLLASKALNILSMIPHGVVQTLQYILAQHGQWRLCMMLWKRGIRLPSGDAPTCNETEEERPPHSLLLHPAGLNTVITALALVNGRPSKHSFTAATSSLLCATATAGGTEGVDAKLLRLLLHLGVIPHRHFTVTEFATLLKDAFGLHLQSSHVDSILSPAAVWRCSEGLPSHMREVLCLMCFRVVARSGLAHTLMLEDLYVIICLSYRTVLSQMCRPMAESSTPSTQRGRENISNCAVPNIQGRCEPSRNGLLTVGLAAATRRTAVFAEEDIRTITEAFLSCSSRLLVPSERAKSFQREEEVYAGVNYTDLHLYRTLVNVRIGRNGSTAMLFTVSSMLTRLLTVMPHVFTLGTVWRGALCALSTNYQLDACDHHLAAAASVFAEVIVGTARTSNKDALVDTLVYLAPLLSPFAIGQIVKGPVGRRLSWTHCLALLPYAPCASGAQRLMLRRIVKDCDVEGMSFVYSLLRMSTPPLQLLPQASPAVSTDVCTLLLLTERSWMRALQAYGRFDLRVQRACAPHIVRLIVTAGAWLPHTHNTGGDANCSHCLNGFDSLLHTALQATEGSRVAEEVLQLSLKRGLWAGGLAFHQRLQHEHSGILLGNGRIKTCAAMLFKGLLSHTALAHTIAVALKHARAARWAEACMVLLEDDGSHDGAEESGSVTHFGVTSLHPAHWSSLFRDKVPPQLSHLAHTVRYSMLCCPGLWQRALKWLPPQALPFPVHHQLLLARVSGLPIGVAAACDAVTPKVETTTPLVGPPLSPMSLVQVALQEKLRCSKASATVASQAEVERTLRVLRQRGQWEQAVLVYEHSLACRCFPHSASATVVGACLPSWQASLSCFAHMSQRMRPDVATASLALQACRRGRKWKIALRVLQQCVLTSASRSAGEVVRTAPQLINYAIQAVLGAGVWDAALNVVRQYGQTMSPLLANTILLTYVRAERYDEAVNFFYGCVRRGVRLHDQSLDLVVAASQAVSAEYHDLARFVGVMASTLEDFCHVHGVLLQHVLLVCRSISVPPHALVLSFSCDQTGVSASMVSDDVINATDSIW